MRTRLSWLVPLVLAGFTAPLAAQDRPVTGRVVDNNTQAGIAGAIITVGTTTRGTQADNDGRFRITLPAGDVSLQIRAIGYKRAQVPVGATQQTVEVALEKDIMRLEDVVVTGEATTVERRTAPTAVSRVSAEELTRVPAAAIENALQGKVLGTRINMNSGAPGGGGQIQIRGVTTILGNGEPLYVVDGVIVNNAQIASGQNSITQASNNRATVAGVQDNATNRLADVNPNDIESIEVLKSVAASAIYGSRATNGVVLITTKRGKSGAPRFQLTQRLGTFDAMRLPGSRRFPDRAAAYQSAAVNIGDTAAARRIVDSVYAVSPNPYFDYQEALYGDADLSYETIATVSGGTETTKYYASATIKKDDAILLNTGSKRDALRINVDQTFGRLTASVGASITRNVADRGLSNNDNTYTSPLYAFGYTPSILDLARPDAAGNFRQNPFPGGGGVNASNPFQTMTYLQNREDVWRQIGTATLRWALVNTDQHTLQLSAIGGVDRYNLNNSIYSPNFLQHEGKDGLFGRAVEGTSNNRQMNGSLNAVWSYSPTWLPLTARTSVGASQSREDLSTYRILARGLIPGLRLVNQGTITTTNQRTRIVDQAFYGQEEVVAFDERLLVSLGVRADRSSANGDVKQFFFYPKAAVSYRFVEPVSAIDFLKVRGAIGQSGLRPNYGDRDLVLTNNGRIGGSEGLGAAATLGNPDVEPERKLEQEYGVDASFIDERIGLEATYFNGLVEKMLLQAPLAPTSGLGQQIINGGEMETDGWEIGLTLNPIRNFRGLEWISRTTFFTVDQTVTKLPVPRFVVANSGFGTAFGRARIAQGASATAIWGNAPLDAQGRILPVGTYVTNPGAVAARRDTIVGEATPDFEMQFGNDFRWRSLGLSLLFDWRKGGDVSNLTNNLFDEGENSRDYDDPSPVAGMTLGEYRYAAWNGGSDARLYVQDGSFVKLREVTLSYTVPTQWVNTVFRGRARDARLTLSGRNLAIWSDYWGGDPEVNNFGNQAVARFVDLAPYPPSRSFFFSVDVGF